MNATEPAPLLDVIRCYAGDASYALEMCWVVSVDRADRLRRQPGADGSIGLVEEEGHAIPVFPLAGQLGQDRSGDDVPGHVIILRGEPAPRALGVDRISRVLQVPSTQLMPLPSLVADASPLSIRGVLELDGGLVLLLAPHRLIPGFTPEPKAGARAYPHAPIFKPPPHAHRYLPGQAERGQIVIFSTAEPWPRKRPLSFGLSITQVLEILDPPPLVAVPRAPAPILGLVNWQGRPTPVIDLAGRLGLPRLPVAGRTRLMIARASLQADPVGFLVHPTIRIRRLPLPHLPCHQAPPVDPSLTRGAIELKNETLVIPDLAGITSF